VARYTEIAMAADILAFIKAGLDIAKGTRSLLASPKKRGNKDDKLHEDLCRALRFIYFPENGVLGLLREIVGGRQISDERREKVLTEFNDYEWKVRDILQTLSFERLEDELGHTLTTISVLARIRDGKSNIREAVQEEINAYGQRNYRLNKSELNN
jgi:hypothetical protein